jgi:hypothetical protein
MTFFQFIKEAGPVPFILMGIVILGIPFCKWLKKSNGSDSDKE